MVASSIPYDMLLAEARTSLLPLAEHLRQELPYVWIEAYRTMTPRRTNIVSVTHGTFDYVYDDYASLEATGVVEADATTEARLVAAIGVSRPNPKRRDDPRLRGWVGPTVETFGDRWDKGHYIAHSIGGAVDGMEANVFLQLRSVNRGAYREMERYRTSNSGVLCFNRPIYGDASALPLSVEFGVVRADEELWLQTFPNR